MPVGAWTGYGGEGLGPGVRGRPVGHSAARAGPALAGLVRPGRRSWRVMIAPSHPERARLGLAASPSSILIKNGLALLTMLVLAAPRRFPRCWRACGAGRAAGAGGDAPVHGALPPCPGRGGRPHGDGAAAGRSAAAAGSPGACSAGLIGMLFLRTFERAERVHDAMLARGWDGDDPQPGRLRPGDKHASWIEANDTQ